MAKPERHRLTMPEEIDENVASRCQVSAGTGCGRSCRTSTTPTTSVADP